MSMLWWPICQGQLLREILTGLDRLTNEKGKSFPAPKYLPIVQQHHSDITRITLRPIPPKKANHCRFLSLASILGLNKYTQLKSSPYHLFWAIYFKDFNKAYCVSMWLNIHIMLNCFPVIAWKIQIGWLIGCWMLIYSIVRFRDYFNQVLCCSSPLANIGVNDLLGSTYIRRRWQCL